MGGGPENVSGPVLFAEKRFDLLFTRVGDIQQDIGGIKADLREIARLNDSYVTLNAKMDLANQNIAVLNRLERNCDQRATEIKELHIKVDAVNVQSQRNKDSLGRAWVWLGTVSAAILYVAISFVWKGHSPG